MEKAYKLLAIQEGISNLKAKDLIDRGVVTVGGKKLRLARGQMKDDTIFKVKDIADARIIFENDEILAIDKPAFLNASEVEKRFPQAVLLNRLDKETSGVMLMAKDEEFRQKAIKEFKEHRVYKEYVAIVEGKVVEEILVDLPISTIKGKVARTRID